MLHVRFAETSSIGSRLTHVGTSKAVPGLGVLTWMLQAACRLCQNWCWAWCLRQADWIRIAAVWRTDIDALQRC